MSWTNISDESSSWSYSNIVENSEIDNADLWTLTGDGISIAGKQILFEYKTSNRTAVFSGYGGIKAGKTYTVKVDFGITAYAGIAWGFYVSVGGAIGLSLSVADNPLTYANIIATMKEGYQVTALADGTAGNSAIVIIGTSIGLGGGCSGVVNSLYITEGGNNFLPISNKSTTWSDDTTSSSWTPLTDKTTVWS